MLQVLCATKEELRISGIFSTEYIWFLQTQPYTLENQKNYSTKRIGFQRFRFRLGATEIVALIDHQGVRQLRGNDSSVWKPSILCQVFPYR